MEAFYPKGTAAPAGGAQLPLQVRDLVQKPLNYDKYRDLENELNQENLVDFISKIAEKYRGELNGNLTTLLAEKLTLDTIITDLENAIETKENKVKRVSTQRDQDEKRVAALKKEIINLKEKIADKQEALKEKEPAFKKMVEQVDAAKRAVTADNLKKVYEFLEKKTAEPVAFIMEALVGILRGMRKADTKSVELYIKKHEGFMIGINRLDLRKLNVEHCKEHLNELKNKYNSQLNSEEFLIFHPHRTLLVQLCLAGLTAQDVAKIETKITQYEGQIHVHQREVEKIEMLLRSIDVESIIKEDYEAFRGQQMSFFKERQAHVEAEISKTKGKLQNFNAEFYAGL